MPPRKDRERQTITSSDVGKLDPFLETMDVAEEAEETPAIPQNGMRIPIPLPPAPVFAQNGARLPKPKAKPEPEPLPLEAEPIVEAPVRHESRPAGMHCGKCGSNAVGHAGGRRRCNQCGHTWE